MDEEKIKEKDLKVEKLEINNVMVIEEVNIQPKEEVVFIAGANKAGKTSVIKSLEIALCGRKSMTGLTKIVRDGEKEANILADFGDIIIKTHFTEDGREALKVLKKDGTEIRRPREVVDAMRNKMLKPYDFKNMRPKEQKELLISSLNLDIDINKLEMDRQEIYELRTVKGRDRDNAKAHLEKMEPPESWENMPISEINVGRLVDELDKIKDHNIKVEHKKEFVIIRNENIEQYEEEIKELQEKIKEETAKKIEAENWLKENKPIDETKTRSEIDKVEEKNIRIRECIKYKELYKTVEDLNAEYDGFTKKITDIDKQKTEALSKAKMPIPGLEIYEDGLGINGIPFAQIAESDQLKAAIGISMGIEPQPQIKVLIIENGRDLDNDSWVEVRKMAKENGYQIWTQYVDESGEIGFVIKEGKIIKINKGI